MDPRDLYRLGRQSDEPNAPPERIYGPVPSLDTNGSNSDSLQAESFQSSYIQTNITPNHYSITQPVLTQAQNSSQFYSGNPYYDDFTEANTTGKSDFHLGTPKSRASWRKSPDSKLVFPRALYPKPCTPFASSETKSAIMGDTFTDSGYASQGRSQQKRKFTDARNQVAPGEQEIADAQSVVSDAQTLGGANIDAYISEFAEELVAILPRTTEATQLKRLSNMLPLLLKAFANRLCLFDDSHLHRQLMYIVTRYRK